jgi:hypothetical protein
MADEHATQPPGGAEGQPLGESRGQQPPQQFQEFKVDTSSLSTVYANFCRVTGTPEELVLDFGLNTSMSPQAGEPIKLTHRLVLNFFTAKRLLGALHMAVQQHESIYGVLEVDVQKRARMQPRIGPRP